MSRAERARGRWVVPVLVAAITFAAFVPALRAGFVTWDDDRNFLDNPAYRGLGWSQLRWMWSTFHMGHYVPLTWMTLGLDYELWEMNPMGYHLQNLLLHSVNAVLVYFLARRILVLASPNGWSARALAGCSAAAALLFAVHPLRVESVAWITERRDMLSLLFCLTSLLLYLRYVRDDLHRTRWYLLSLVAFACALLSKATSVSLPVVLLMLNVYPLRRIGGTAGDWGADIRAVYAGLLPFVALAGGVSLLSVVALQPPEQLALPSKVAVSAYSVAFYVSRTFVPIGLAPLYEMPKTVNPMAIRYVVGYGVVVLLTAGAWAMRRRYPGATTAWLVFLVVLLPMLGLVQNGPQIAADRYTYHAAPALAILAGAALGAWRVPAALRLAVSGAAVAVLGALTWKQTGIWHDSERLWSRVLRVDSTSSIAQIAMGDVLIAQDRLDEGAEHYERGLELDPTFATGFNNLGVVNARRGNLSDAIGLYRRALELKPSYADAHNNLGIALSEQGDYAGAIEHFTRAIALDASNPAYEVNLGNLLVRQRRPDEAIGHYARAAGLRPSGVDAYLNWGVALTQMGKIGEAMDQFRRVLAIQPDNADARRYLKQAEQMR